MSRKQCKEILIGKNKTTTLCDNIILQHHDTPLAGHYSCFKTVGDILHDYWWPTIQQDVRIYTEGCKTCQQTKSHQLPSKTLLHPFNPPSQPWEVITIASSALSQNVKAITLALLSLTGFTKAVKYEAAHLELNSEGCARIL
jgi:hypothetical protein